jgi:membrane associated rhomboid family serine protease
MPIRLTPAVKALLIASFAFFVIQHTADQFFGMHLLSVFALVPSSVVNDHWFWQLFTYPFLHGDVMHLFLNLMMLAFMGGELEAAWGTPRFLRFFFFCSTLAGLLYLFLQIFARSGQGLHLPMVGGSGAIYGLLMAYGLIFGERVLLFMMLFPMKAKYFVWILAGIELMTTVFSGSGGLASAAHLGGMAAGFGYLWGRATYSVWKKRQVSSGGQIKGGSAAPKKKRIQPQHLKLVINNKNQVELESTEDDNDPPTFH